MAKFKEPVGLGPRIAAAERLETVLRGAPFTPLNSDEMADDRDRAMTNRLVTTAIRRTGHLNLIIDEALERGLPKRSGRFEAVLRIALTELLFLPNQADHSAVFLAVEALKGDKKAAHLSRLMNGVLRGVQRNAGKYQALDLMALFPEWLLVRWERHFGAEAVSGFGTALLEGAPLDLTLRDEDAELMTSLGGQIVSADTVRVTERDKSVAALPGYGSGRWWVQDAASAIPARLMTAAKGANVLDMCAAPGGKTAQLVKAGYRVTALDNDPIRLRRVGDNLKRLGYEAKLVEADGATAYTEPQFEGVLVDAPCSATGTFRRHPEVVWNRNRKDILARTALQQELLTGAVNSLKEDGVLIYSTCSLEREEGEDQVAWLTNALPFMHILPIRADEVPGFGDAVIANGCLRLHPGRIAPGQAGGTTDGFFIARFRRGRVQT